MSSLNLVSPLSTIAYRLSERCILPQSSSDLQSSTLTLSFLEDCSNSCPEIQMGAILLPEYFTAMPNARIFELLNGTVKKSRQWGSGVAYVGSRARAIANISLPDPLRRHSWYRKPVSVSFKTTSS
mgnify:CR=1 FL=1